MTNIIPQSSQDRIFKGSLITLTFMIFGMVIIGGLTRLSGSGLSIVEWKPIVGIFPPLTHADWLFEFSKYQQSPEFQKINFGMTLDDFKSIFWLEYIHRLWGRILGIILLIPTFLMIYKKQYRDLWLFLAFLWLLGMTQGIMGWYMVKSGLVNDPHVSPYRLAAHLCLGFALFGIALWMTLSLYKNHFRPDRKGFSHNAFQMLTKLSFAAVFLVLLTAFFGALVAGHKAGLVYNTFPLMGDNLIPHEFLSSTPWWNDFLENPVSVQFLHRLLAVTTAGLCLGIWIYQRKLEIPQRLAFVYAGLALIVLVQFSFGVLTLLFMVPVALGVLHQGFAFILFGSLLFAFFLLQSVKQ
ncbi:MAG: COX15/CtaA family protein [Proteobacteria bacterium]|nr:COX15/CtaA family protein [Pseudomonadota bacterium]